MRLLVTRPEPDATRTTDALRGRGHAVVAAPLMQMQPIAAEITGPFAAVALTSANAVRAIAAHARARELMALRLFAVGARSAEAARAVGFVHVTSADGALGDLARLVAQHVRRGERVLYLAGADRAGDLAAELAPHGIAVETVVVYRAAAADALPREIAETIGTLDGALHYSRRSAATLLHLAARAGARDAVVGLAHYCLSEEIAGVWRAAGATRVHVAAHPDETALLALI
jgi:uroporphyrinogen-III synthase